MGERGSMPCNKEKQKEIQWRIEEWFVIIDNLQAGPYSLSDLDRNPKFTPDTLVWKKGYKEWTKARFVLEMKELFKDRTSAKPLHDPSNGKESKQDYGQENQATLTLQQDPYQLLLWVLLFLIIIFYLFYFRA